MLNLSIDITSNVTIGESFERIARSLLSEYCLVANDKTYILIDIEFYYFNEKVHSDPYVHKHELQRTTSNSWYFHGSGVDITFGIDNNYGGILVRGVAEISDGKIKDAINGPLRIVTEIFSIKGSVFSDANNFPYFKPYIQDNLTIFRTKRVGIARNKDKDEFHDARYRFLSHFNLPHSEKTKIANDLLSQNRSVDFINKQAGYKIL